MRGQSLWQLASLIPPNGLAYLTPLSVVLLLLYRQASLRYRELNDALETVQEKLRDARVRGGFLRGGGHGGPCEKCHQQIVLLIFAHLSMKETLLGQ